MGNDSFLFAIFLGIVQGITEFLPISSSGHLIVISAFLNGEPIPLVFNVALHFGTALAVIIYFWKDWLDICRALVEKIFKSKDSPLASKLLPALIIGSIPAGILGFTAKNSIEALFHHPLSVAAPLFIVGFILWFVDKQRPMTSRLTDISLWEGFLIGLFQASALIPGVSRSGATIIGARFMGVNRKDAIRFSMLLGTPPMLAATALHANELSHAAANPVFLSAVATAFIVGLLFLHLLVTFFSRYGFLGFAIYRALVAGAIWALH